MNKNLLSALMIAGLLSMTLHSCRSDKNQTNASGSSDSTSANEVQADSLSLQQMKEGLPIFYNMYLSVDMTRLFESAGAAYNPEVLNPVEKEKEYNTSGKKAVNLGVYSVDLGYIRAYEQYEKTRAYFEVMRNISSSLGIPEDFFIKSSERYDSNITDKDSLVKIANEVYLKTTEYLKANDRESSSALIVLGGWIEAVYIATRMMSYSDKDTELIERVADQKNSIGNLLDMIGKYKDDKEVATYYDMISDLKTSFEKVTVDPANLKASFPQLKEVAGKIGKIRSAIVK